MSIRLGELQAVDLRQLWQNEATDFTPWLAAPENMQRLGDAIGLELEVENTEVSVGPFSADILARETATGNYVVIENQLGKTDHDHLGKALTYAATLNAHTIVWIAARFTDEHRKALDWLNANTGEGMAFVGVQVELWAIDGSNPAIRFNVVSRPDETMRQAVASASASASPTKALQLEFWTQFREKLIAANVVPSTHAPGPRYWYNVALGRSGYHLSLAANVDSGFVRVRLYMQGRYNADEGLRQLLSQKEAIEREIGEPLMWNPNPDASDKTIALERHANIKDRATWPELIDWMVDTVARMRSVFRDRVLALDLPRSEDD